MEGEGELAQLVPKKQKSLISYFFEHPRQSIKIENFVIFGTRAPALQVILQRSSLYITGELAQLARAPALHAGGHRFDSDILHHRSPKPWQRRVSL